MKIFKIVTVLLLGLFVGCLSVGCFGKSTEDKVISSFTVSRLVYIDTEITGTSSAWFEMECTGENERVKKGSNIAVFVKFACDEDGKIKAPVSNKYNGVIQVFDERGKALTSNVVTSDGIDTYFYKGGFLEEETRPSGDVVWGYSFVIPSDYEYDRLTVKFIPILNGSYSY